MPAITDAMVLMHPPGADDWEEISVPLDSSPRRITWKTINATIGSRYYESLPITEDYILLMDEEGRINGSDLCIRFRSPVRGVMAFFGKLLVVRRGVLRDGSGIYVGLKRADVPAIKAFPWVPV
jgi:hypothetical protein